MEFIKFLFVFSVLMVVINSSYSSIIPRQCETPELKNGVAQLRQRGEKIRYYCLPSFTLIGEIYSTCVEGQWENPVPMCTSSAQTCVHRCQENASYSLHVRDAIMTSLNKFVNILPCDCYDGCVDRKSCCLDYRSVCVFDSTTTDTTESEPIEKIATSTNATVDFNIAPFPQHQ